MTIPPEGLLLSLADKVHPDNAVLLVIDVQNDFIAEGGFADRAGWNCLLNRRAARNIQDFLVEARRAGVPVIFIQGIYDDIYLGAPMIERNIRRNLPFPRCHTGTWGADFYLLEPEPDEIIIQKHRYSGFVETDLPTVLRQLGRQSLIFTGVYTEGCVESTARHAYFLDHYVVMVGDCCGTTDERIHRDALDRCERDFGIVASSDEILSIWKGL